MEGFDTASSVALLALSAIAKRGTDGKTITSSNIVILPLLFTAGMTMVDSADSILMLYSYAGFPKQSWAFFETTHTPEVNPPELKEKVTKPTEGKAIEASTPLEIKDQGPQTPVDTTMNIVPAHTRGDASAALSVPDIPGGVDNVEGKVSRETAVKMNVMSGLSIILTLMSILVAFRYVEA
ncbi:hypothetical protein DXG01_006764 [Tephrocybe rancida]|nr:hypothetical protein DXG01_006764 [Tephrocybe rancida]